MSTKVKIILAVLVIVLTMLGAVVVVYLTSKKAVTTPEGNTVPPTEAEIAQPPKMGRFDLGEFVATARDNELHYIKIQVEVGYVGALEQELTERKSELRDKIINILMKLNVQRAKEDYIDRFLHKDIENGLNELLGKSTSESRIIQVVIPTFLIN